MIITVGVDQSKRSTAVVAISDKGYLIDFMLICPAIELDNEELLIYHYDELFFFLDKYDNKEKVLAIEGLSYGSVSSSKDLLAGLFWYIRTRLKVMYPDMLVGVIPCASWRAKVLSKEERQEISKLKVKDGLKKATVSKLPFSVRVRFEDYIRQNSFKKESVYDLCDAYWIAQYRRNLS